MQGGVWSRLGWWWKRFGGVLGGVQMQITGRYAVWSVGRDSIMSERMKCEKW